MPVSLRTAGTVRARIRRSSAADQLSITGSAELLTVYAKSAGRWRHGPRIRERDGYRFPGQIVDTTYLGSTVQYQLQVQSGPLMKLTEFNPFIVRPPCDDEVRAMVAMHDVVIIRK